MPEGISGPAIETLFLQELVAINAYLKLGYNIFYWMTSNNVEVDFVLYGNKDIQAFEIKRTAKVSSSMFKGLKVFQKDYPKAKAYFIYGGERVLREGNIEIIPNKRYIEKTSGHIISLV